MILENCLLNINVWGYTWWMLKYILYLSIVINSETGVFICCWKYNFYDFYNIIPEWFVEWEIPYSKGFIWWSNKMCLVKKTWSLSVTDETEFVLFFAISTHGGEWVNSIYFAVHYVLSLSQLWSDYNCWLPTTRLGYMKQQNFNLRCCK